MHHLDLRRPVRTCLVALLLLLAAAVPAAVTYYVGPNGNDGNPGLSTSAPFLTIQQAANRTNPGDTVLIMPGTYTSTVAGGDVVTITRSGTANAYITYKNQSSTLPVLYNQCSWFAVDILGAAYVIIDGLEVRGRNASITEAQARLNAFDPVTNGSGIAAKTNDDTGAIAHHIVIRNCVVHDVPGGGIGSMKADYLTIDRNTVYNTSWWSLWGTSGISIYESHLLSGPPPAGYHNLVTSNICYGNKQLLPASANGLATITDGNGIIIDDLQNTQQTPHVPYTARTLVQNNVCYGNGGRGVHVFNSQHVDVVNNTAYDNDANLLTDGAELSLLYADDVKLINNIGYARSGCPASATYANGANITRTDNLYCNGSVAASGAGDLIQDPRFVNAGAADFRLQSGSPGIDSGVVVAGVTSASDIVGTARPQGGGLDRGAYECVVAVDTTPPATPAAPGLSNPTSATPTLSGSSEANATVRIYDNGVLVGTVTTNASGAWSWTSASALASGTHAFTISASDAAGNTSARSSASVVQVAGADPPAAPSVSSGGGGGNGCGAGGMAVLVALLAGALACHRPR